MLLSFSIPATAFVTTDLTLSLQPRNCWTRSVTILKENNEEFWEKQKVLVQQLNDSSEKNRRAEMQEKFAKRRMALVGDTAYFTFFIFCTLWTIFPNPLLAFSYLFGATMGIAYSYGLGKYVETVGGSAVETESLRGAGVGEARFAFLILLFVIVGRFRNEGLMEVPSIAGFFTYQVSPTRIECRQTEGRLF